MRIDGRFAQMTDRYTRIVKDYFSGPGWNRDELPNAYDGSRLWKYDVLEDDARAPLDSDTSEEQRALVFELLAEYPTTVMEFLSTALETVERAHAESQSGDGQGDSLGTQGGSWPESPRDALRRPTALFQCGDWKCRGEPYAWPAINVHRRDEHPNESVWADGRVQAFKAVAWKDGIEIAEKMLAALIKQGLSDRDMDKSRLDKLIKKGRVFCACGDPRMAAPGEGLTWVALVGYPHFPAMWLFI